MAIPFSVFKPTGIAQFSILEKANEGINNLNEKEAEELKKLTGKTQYSLKTHVIAEKGVYELLIKGGNSYVP